MPKIELKCCERQNIYETAWGRKFCMNCHKEWLPNGKEWKPKKVNGNG